MLSARDTQNHGKCPNFFLTLLSGGRGVVNVETFSESREWVYYFLHTPHPPTTQSWKKAQLQNWLLLSSPNLKNSSIRRKYKSRKLYYFYYLDPPLKKNSGKSIRRVRCSEYMMFRHFKWWGNKKIISSYTDYYSKITREYFIHSTFRPKVQTDTQAAATQLTVQNLH